VAAFEKTLEYWDDPEVRRVLGFLYSELGDTAKAAEFLSTSGESNPNEVVFINSVLKGNEAFLKNNF
jgi:hypothetical protein